MACYLCKRNENLSIDEIAFGLLWFYVYRDFGKWGREKLGENGLLSNRNENLFIDESALDDIWSNFMRRDLVSWGKRFSGIDRWKRMVHWSIFEVIRDFVVSFGFFGRGKGRIFIKKIEERS